MSKWERMWEKRKRGGYALLVSRPQIRPCVGRQLYARHVEYQTYVPHGKVVREPLGGKEGQGEKKVESREIHLLHARINIGHRVALVALS
jgi:hypothetical protein